jgi:hypothetical protein
MDKYVPDNNSCLLSQECRELVAAELFLPEKNKHCIRIQAHFRLTDKARPLGKF